MENVAKARPVGGITAIKIAPDFVRAKREEASKFFRFFFHVLTAYSCYPDVPIPNYLRISQGLFRESRGY